MPVIHMIADVYRAWEVGQVDFFSGADIPLEYQTKFCFLLPVRCASASRDIEVGVMVLVEVPLAKMAEISVESGQRLTVAARAASLQVKELLERRGGWDLYRAERLTLSDDRPLPVTEAFQIEADVETTELLAAHFREATKRHNAVEEAMEKAKKYLGDGLNNARQEASGMVSAARFIVDCMKADATPLRSGWNAEKSSVLLAHVEDLVDRKNPNHTNYISMVKSVRSTLHSVKCPSFWGENPPQPQMLQLD